MRRGGHGHTADVTGIADATVGDLGGSRRRLIVLVARRRRDRRFGGLMVRRNPGRIRLASMRKTRDQGVDPEPDRQNGATGTQPPGRHDRQISSEQPLAATATTSSRRWQIGAGAVPAFFHAISRFARAIPVRKVAFLGQGRRKKNQIAIA